MTTQTLTDRPAAAGDDRYDLIVVGAGAAGMPAATFAARRGLKVLLLESQEAIGGSLWVSTGQISAAGTRLQRDKGIADTAQEHYDDVMRISHGTADPGLVRLAVDNAADTVDWLMDNGFAPEPEHPIKGHGHEPYSVERYYWGPDGGRSLMHTLIPLVMGEVATGGVTLRLRHTVRDLIVEDGHVAGVVAEDGEGQRHRFRGGAVALTTGGYAANAALYQELCGHPQISALPYVGSQGIGHGIGQAAGGYLRGRENYFIGFGMILDSDEMPAMTTIRAETFPERRQPWEIYVNRDGRRFVREDVPSVDARETALMQQPDFRYWIVFDEAILRQAPPLIRGWSSDQMREAFAAGRPSFLAEETLDGLARRAGIDPAGLRGSVEGYNYGVMTGNDFFGRQHHPLPIGEGPFYAIRLQGGSVSSAVGLAVNDRLEVVKPDGTPIPGLYAAGELLGSGQTMGKAACGGMMATPAITFGRLLGQRLAVPASNVA